MITVPRAHLVPDDLKCMFDLDNLVAGICVHSSFVFLRPVGVTLFLAMPFV